ncbi:D-2-hydroxyglutarate dehydrogenase, mitochondrial [Athalia rosae]|uniref:D-2-hydroxyglutarate dehydrogenase, mitochondrial n=1 Tax=Athalia rosae TaxID=37344 RepID=UPI002034502A|nr:D-2-hydroxyglutarate dehydrogenase, mitochondrial [Athalia rosae]
MLGNVKNVLCRVQHGTRKGGLDSIRLTEAKTMFFAMDHSRAISQKPEPTAVRYKVTRGPYATVTDSHLQFLENLLGKERLLTDPDECESYNVDWARMVRGCSRVVVKPKTTEEVSAILQYCNENRLAVCPQGGNTGLVGGSVPVFDEIVLSTSLMNKIIDLDETSSTVVCEAGCILETLDTHLVETANMMMPLDLGAKGSCQIGGCISTNAGGIRLLRYGNLHGNVLGLEAVKANGEIVDCLNTLKKDNTGYHLKHLFIGSEGTLGIVTKVAIQCPPVPKSLSVALLGLTSFDDVLKTYRLAKTELAEILSSCEMMDRSAMAVCTDNLGMKNPLAVDNDGYEFYLLIEISGSHAGHDAEKLNTFLEKAMEQELVQNGTVATEPTKIKNIWSLRDSISNGILLDGYPYKYDVSLRLSDYYQTVEALRKHLTDPRIKRVSGYGHIGDGNLHVQVTTSEYIEEVAQQIEPFIFEYVSNLKGSVSAEHGIGFKKTKFLHLSKNPSAIKLMYELKQLMDPNGILNPYKVLPTL